MIRKLLRYSMIGASAAFTASTSSAQSPEDLVRWIYTSLPQPGGSLGYVTSEAERDRYLSHRLAAFFAADDSYGDDMQSACLDFGPAIPGNDYNAAEIVRSLAVSTEVDGAQTRVKAAFTTFGEPVEIVYSFVVEDGLWQLDDIAGPGYRLSEIPCTPRAASPQAAAKVTGYCYRKAQDSLRLEVAPDGQAHFELWSEQGGGHSCSATGPARPTQSGWVYEEDFSGTSCRVEILVTAERGLRLTDKDWACKPALCGARAVLDGLSFAPQDQIDCATLPPLGQ
jgi:hypothetical protein